MGLMTLFGAWFATNGLDKRRTTENSVERLLLVVHLELVKRQLVLEHLALQLALLDCAPQLCNCV